MAKRGQWRRRRGTNIKMQEENWRRREGNEVDTSGDNRRRRGMRGVELDKIKWNRGPRGQGF
jgi:hypothetical protein